MKTRREKRGSRSIRLSFKKERPHYITNSSRKKRSGIELDVVGEEKQKQSMKVCVYITEK